MGNTVDESNIRIKPPWYFVQTVIPDTNPPASFHPLAYRTYSKDLFHLWNLLVNALAGCEKQIWSEDEIRILDMACAHCAEAPLLNDFFSRYRTVWPRKITLLGVDPRAPQIEEAAYTTRRAVDLERLASKTRTAEFTFEFLQGDGSKRKGRVEEAGPFNLVFIRHQNAWYGTRTWARIFERCLHRLPVFNIIIGGKDQQSVGGQTM